MASMMDEMAKTLARRRAAAESKPPAANEVVCRMNFAKEFGTNKKNLGWRRRQETLGEELR
jgi:hypothetical protein